MKQRTARSRTARTHIESFSGLYVGVRGLSAPHSDSVLFLARMYFFRVSEKDDFVLHSGWYGSYPGISHTTSIHTTEKSDIVSLLLRRLGV